MADFYGFDTLSLHAGHTPDERHGSRAVPIHQTTSYVFRDSRHAAALYNLEEGGHLYSRISNPTVAVLEQRLAALDGAAAATATASGMAALHTAVACLLSAGDHIVSTAQLYGANINLLKNTLPRFGIETTFVSANDIDGLEAAIRPNTKLIFGEIIGNPGLDILDLPRVGEIASARGIPVMIDGTFNTPWLCKPLEMGANIVIHSVTKWLGGHGVAIGGAIVDGGNFDWGVKDADGNVKFPTLAAPHYALDGIVFWEEFGPAAFTQRVRMEGMYNFGPCMSPQTAFYLLQGLETLPLRMKRHQENTAAMLDFLTAHEQVTWVRHPSLPDHPNHELAERLLPRGAGSVVVFGVAGGREGGAAFIEALELASHLANVGDAKTLVIHPASTTHSHISAEDMKAGGLSEDMIRLSIGLEDIDDLKADFEKGLRAAKRVAKAKSVSEAAE
ncbi:O-acetylhomoserine aminocarboxypropyltransferase [Oricola cellulosilytica]|uniref:O-acetylhomoserine aminocarboxypropyltransferase n=1 Tax=Oricola cellulosilytica TaxID=1429082 RepID=A0A4R0P6G1_9HYPH|nr:O-acetylhomoserine aminocarboxypropyltransferase [Oricola cellulosilytica]TCD12309.1 O-acetylhomoserine aminocarboxypropyltransferase [Oricola cellulosilytica]